MDGHYQCWDGIVCLCAYIEIGWHDALEAYDFAVAESLNSAGL